VVALAKRAVSPCGDGFYGAPLPTGGWLPPVWQIKRPLILAAFMADKACGL
jgi:hypothetical protein